MKPKLLASAQTLEKITTLINQFWYSTSYTIDPETLQIQHPTRTPPAGFQITKQGSRFRFERVEQSSALL